MPKNQKYKVDQVGDHLPLAHCHADAVIRHLSCQAREMALPSSLSKAVNPSFSPPSWIGLEWLLIFNRSLA
ncbi:hypothetical protein HanRHA438_Chr05g0218321 [Helianthus annuus]|nr:hypothetical protein HanRHA438_Chr05g0218321 [Helianthus annuus]